MWAPRYWANDFWAPRYWAKAGAAGGVAPAGTPWWWTRMRRRIAEEE